MSKSHRGKGIRERYRRGRGVCPVCKRTGIKIVYEVDKQYVCKICKAKVSHQKQEEVVEKVEKKTEEKTVDKAVEKPVEKATAQEEKAATQAEEKPEGKAATQDEKAATKTEEKPTEE